MNYSRPFHNNHIIALHAYASKNVKSENVEFHIERALHVVAILCQSIWKASCGVSIRCNEQIQTSYNNNKIIIL